VGQLDDEMEDFIQVMRPTYPSKKWTLLGFSSGAGFALRISGDPQGKEFDRFILLSPFLRYNALTPRQDAAKTNDDAHWYSVSIGRIIGLSFLGSRHAGERRASCELPGRYSESTKAHVGVCRKCRRAVLSGPIRQRV
jgi:hypothetical protein